ncbi:hypothetical protein VTP01DRAFT_6328 [Rhizomucor pusillus]|uniref:uncharacterized protein n=1 Tax=Rhizomucor pusillus TaxID=4840 RepID=UPI003742EE13
MDGTSSLEAKVVILGSTGVGKTSVVVRYVENSFKLGITSTVGASFMTKKLTIDDCHVRLQIWDTAGQERFRSMGPMYYRGAHAAILVYDITSQESFLEMDAWAKELARAMVLQDMIVYILGNKLDLCSQRAVPLAQAEEYAEKTLGPDSLATEVSAKEDNGEIEEVFYQLAYTLVEREFGRERYPWQSNQLLDDEQNSIASSKRGCC